MGAATAPGRVNTAALSVSAMGFLNICKGLNFTGHSRAGFEVCHLEGSGDF